MLIVLDTNIYQQDYLLRSPRFVVLLDYLKRTHSRVALPQVVLHELLANYRRDLQDRSAKLREATRLLASCRLPAMPQPPEIDVDAEVSGYEAYLLQTLGITPDQIFPMKAQYLEDAFKRAINRTPPCTQKGEDMRDALLWSSLKDISRELGAGAAVFISANKRQFADDELTLSPQLALEAKQEALNLSFFGSLESFARDHATPIEFITAGWITANLDFGEVVASLKDRLQLALAKKLAPRVGIFTALGPTPALLGGELSLDDFFVNELADGSHRIELDASGELEFEVEPPHADVFDLGSEYEITPPAFSFPVPYPVTYSTSGSSSGLPYASPERVLPWVEVTLDIHVVDKAIDSWESIDYTVSLPLRYSRHGA